MLCIGFCLNSLKQLDIFEIWSTSFAAVIPPCSFKWLQFLAPSIELNEILLYLLSASKVTEVPVRFKYQIYYDGRGVIHSSSAIYIVILKGKGFG